VRPASFTADFNDLTNVNRVVNNTSADAVIKWEGPIIAAGNKYTFQVTLPDCVFESPSPTVRRAGGGSAGRDDDGRVAH
jgi:hypothetical protein